LRAARILEISQLSPDVPHEKNRAVLGEKGRRSGVLYWDRKTEPAFRLVPKLSVPIETESDFLIVNDHFLQCAHDILDFLNLGAT
jgi:hypothetical protein